MCFDVVILIIYNAKVINTVLISKYRGRIFYLFFTSFSNKSEFR